MVKLGTIALDGTKIKANASKHKAMSYGRMKEQEQKLKQEIEALLERARIIDAEEERVWVWSKQMNSCLWSFEDARSVWPRSRRPRHVGGSPSRR